MEPQQQQSAAPLVAPTVTAPSATPEAPKAHEPAYVGLIIAACIVLLLLVLGGLYLWGSTALTSTPHPELAAEQQAEDPDAPLDAISADLSADLTELDQDLASLDTAFSAEATATSTAE